MKHWDAMKWWVAGFLAACIAWGAAAGWWVGGMLDRRAARREEK